MIVIQEKIQVMNTSKDQEQAINIANNVPLSDMESVDLSDYKVKKD